MSGAITKRYLLTWEAAIVKLTYGGLQGPHPSTDSCGRLDLLCQSDEGFISAAAGHLIVELPAEVRDDSVTVAFSARVLRNATVFDVVLGHIDRPGLWQSVEARSRRDNIVFLPQLAGDDRLIGDLLISPQTFTPNGDGVNDEVEVRFALYKVDAAAPRVRVFDLLGREVAGFTPAASGALQYFRWDGRDPSGNIVPPGIYLCQIDAMAEAGAGEVLQTISVAY